MVPFHSNPSPNNITWEISGEGIIGMNGSIGRFTSLGWEEYVSLHITCPRKGKISSKIFTEWNHTRLHHQNA